MLAGKAIEPSTSDDAPSTPIPSVIIDIKGAAGSKLLSPMSEEKPKGKPASLLPARRWYKAPLCSKSARNGDIVDGVSDVNLICFFATHVHHYSFDV